MSQVHPSSTSCKSQPQGVAFPIFWQHILPASIPPTLAAWAYVGIVRTSWNTIPHPANQKNIGIHRPYMLCSFTLHAKVPTCLKPNSMLLCSKRPVLSKTASPDSVICQKTRITLELHFSCTKGLRVTLRQSHCHSTRHFAKHWSSPSPRC